MYKQYTTETCIRCGEGPKKVRAGGKRKGTCAACIMRAWRKKNKGKRSWPPLVRYSVVGSAAAMCIDANKYFVDED